MADHDVTVARKDLVSVLRGMLGMVVLAVVGLLLFGISSCRQDHINARQDRSDARLQQTIDRQDAYIDAQLHQRDLDAAAACVSNHVRYELFKQLMTDLVGDRPDVWQRYPTPPCDRAEAQALLDKG